MADSPLVALSLQSIRPVTILLNDSNPSRRSWFSRLGVSGLRRQVIRHAGLSHYDCDDPTGLSPELRTVEWQALVDRIEQFEKLDDATRALVVFNIAQLSFCSFAAQLAGTVQRNGDPMRDHYIYELGRVYARTTDHFDRALRTFTQLAEHWSDRLLALASCFQGIGHALRRRGAADVARDFERRGRLILAEAAPVDEWESALVRSRFHRSVAMLRLFENRAADAHAEANTAIRYHEELTGTDRPNGRLVIAENRQYILELQLSIAQSTRAEETRQLCRAILDSDPFSVDAALRAGDGLAAMADYFQAASCYERAGSLGTIGGALGWFRAAQCYEIIGDRQSAGRAMERCLELDHLAVEPRAYLDRLKTGAEATTGLPDADRAGSIMTSGPG